MKKMKLFRSIIMGAPGSGLLSENSDKMEFDKK